MPKQHMVEISAVFGSQLLCTSAVQRSAVELQSKADKPGSKVLLSELGRADFIRPEVQKLEIRRANAFSLNHNFQWTR